MELIFEKSRPGRRAGRVPTHDLPVPDVPDELRRREPPRLPEVPENEIVRHFTALADRNFGIDTGFYPVKPKPVAAMESPEEHSSKHFPSVAAIKLLAFVKKFIERADPKHDEIYFAHGGDVLLTEARELVAAIDK